MDDAIRRGFGGRLVDLPHGAEGFEGRAGHRQLHDVGFAYCFYGARTRVEFPAGDFFRLQIPLQGSAESRVRHIATPVAADHTCLIGAGVPVAIDFRAGFEQIVLRINRVALETKLAGLLGARPGAGLEFDNTVDLRPPATQTLRRYIDFVVAEIDATEAEMAPQSVAVLEDALMVHLLLGCRHNASHLLARPARAAAPWQVRRVESYIEAHWNRPLTVETLAQVADTSVRSVFHAFRQSRGYSPMAFLKQVRLDQARRMLTMPNAETSVLGVVLHCCFGNAGHFAKDYFVRFGELPSETLNRAKGASAQDSRKRA